MTVYVNMCAYTCSFMFVSAKARTSSVVHFNATDFQSVGRQNASSNNGFTHLPPSLSTNS